MRYVCLRKRDISSLRSNAICLLTQTRYIVASLQCDMFAHANEIYCRYAPMRYVCLRKRDISSLRSNAICLLTQTRYIVASLQCDINPSRPAGHIVRRSLISLPKEISQGAALYRFRREYRKAQPYIAPGGNISNPSWDLYRCVLATHKLSASSYNEKRDNKSVCSQNVISFLCNYFDFLFFSAKVVMFLITLLG